MNDISTDLLFLLLIGAFFLFQYVMQRVRRNKRQESTAEESPAQAPEEQAAGTQWDWVVPDAAPEAAPVMSAIPSPAPGIEPMGAQTLRPRYRFSRAALMGDKRRLQDAVVIATILGPCRAAQPHETAQ